ncbi:MAG: LCP family protein [Herbinix sp.]|nr:LCP family protein [Herbinix sp.]
MDEGDKKSKPRKILIISGSILLVLILVFAWLGFTRSGRRVIYKIAGRLIYQGLDKDDEIEENSVIIPYDKATTGKDKNKADAKEKDTSIDEQQPFEEVVVPRIKPEARKEDYVSNFLLFGIEEIFNAKNADTIMIASVNTKDSTIKLTSLLRDSYIDVEGYNPNKLNAFFSLGGAKTFVHVIEDKYRIKIDGYAYINFESFEKIIDYLGGIAIELGEKEADYLNNNNYISNPANRNVIPGWNDLNGNQALGYCRIRLVETMGGANDDYGRTLRQRRVIKAVFNKYKSKGLLDLLRISKNILGYVKTNVTQEQIEKTLEDIIENKITKMETMRLPVNGAYEAPTKYLGIGYPLVYDWDENIIQLYQFIYLDTREEAESNLEKYK